MDITGAKKEMTMILPLTFPESAAVGWGVFE